MPAKPNLLADIVALNTPRKGPPCTMGIVLQELPEDDIKGLLQALDNPTIKSTAIRRALEGRGYKVNDNTIGRHRRKECLCES